MRKIVTLSLIFISLNAPTNSNALNSRVKKELKAFGLGLITISGIAFGYAAELHLEGKNAKDPKAKIVAYGLRNLGLKIGIPSLSLGGILYYFGTRNMPSDN